jgi:hypothetical protein
MRDGTRDLENESRLCSQHDTRFIRRDCKVNVSFYCICVAYCFSNQG